MTVTDVPNTNAAELVDASLKERLWHSLREDLARYCPEMSPDMLMCCTCGRFLRFDDFCLEHIIPRQALSDDPHQVKTDPQGTANLRAGVTLLCKKPLRIKERVIYQNGCNSWKGRYYDSPIREVLSGIAATSPRRHTTNRHLIALICASYLAMVRNYGYQIALIQSGALMRQQFFMPNGFHRDMPFNCQIVLSAPPPTFEENHKDLWLTPFKFDVERASCLVTLRTNVIRVPLSRDPRIANAQHLPFKPSKYKLRPDFRTVFE